MNGSPHDYENAPDALVTQSRVISTDVVSAARTIAYERGHVIERDGLAIFAIGAATKISFQGGISANPARVVEILRKIGRVHFAEDVSPIAIAAIPYVLSAPSEFLIPSIAVMSRAGSPPIGIYTAHPDEMKRLMERDLIDEAGATISRAVKTSPDQFALNSVIPHEVFLQKIDDARDAIQKQRLQKVVLAREVRIEANRPFIQRDIIERLRSLHPSCLTFAIDGFFGASPELVLSKLGAHIASTPLAGTVARSGDPEEDRHLQEDLMQSPKERREHRYVIEAIRSVLQSFTSSVSIPESPHVVELRNVVHLATRISGQLVDPATSILEILSALHPTPAVCGTPRMAASEYIDEHEGLDRDRYAGLVGYTDVHGDGEWWLGIRSAIVTGNTAKIIAGVGIVEDSVASTELAETQLKLQAMLAVLVRP